MPRTPLGPISANAPHCKELSPYERGLIVGRISGGATTAEVRKDLLVPESTIRTTLSRSSYRVDGVSKPRNGCPKSCSIREQRHIICTARAKPEITYQDLIETTGVNCSKSTVYRILKEYGLTNWLAKKRPLLREEDAAKRLAWAKERKDWTDDNWKR